MTDLAPLIAGVELGGTKIVVLLARDRMILKRARLPTGAPGPTLCVASDRLADWASDMGPIAALGIASFGPLGLDPERRDFGHITTTPKPGWAHQDVLGHFKARFDVPIGFDTDVAGAALAEYQWGAGVGCDVVVYLTIGTGIGGGLVVAGRPVHGRVHPEMGHMRVRRSQGDPFLGICPFHGDCLEGLVSGPALAARAGLPAEDLGTGHPVWSLAASEIAELASSLILTLSPNRILIGGGVAMGKPFLFPLIRAGVAERLNGYVAGISASVLRQMIRRPGLGDRAGPLGAIALGASAMRSPGAGVADPPASDHLGDPR